MDTISDTMAISDARANLTELVNNVRIQDCTVLLHRRGKPQAFVIPPDFKDLMDAVGGLDAVREILRAQVGDATR